MVYLGLELIAGVVDVEEEAEMEWSALSSK